MKKVLIWFTVFSILSLAIVALFYRAEAIKQKANYDAAVIALDAAVETNKAQKVTIITLEAQRIKDGVIISNLTNEVNALNTAATHTRNEIDNLGRSNHEVRAYLDSPIPVDLMRLLNAP